MTRKKISMNESLEGKSVGKRLGILLGVLGSAVFLFLSVKSFPGGGNGKTGGEEKLLNIRIFSFPEKCQVSLAGKLVGETPLVLPVPSGTLFLGLKKDGFEDLKKEIHEFRNGQTFVFRLTPLMEPSLSEAGFEGSLKIRTEKDAMEARRRLVEFLWGKSGLPVEKIPEEYQTEPGSLRFPDVAKVRSFLVKMDFGMIAKCQYFIPGTRNKNLVIFHRGHVEDPGYENRIIATLLRKGCSVAVFSMPLRGENSRPIIPVEPFGKLTMTSHSQMRFLKPLEGHPVKFFIEPVVLVLNGILDQEKDVRRVFMLGLEGGGWTTTLTAAVDPRIDVSIPVSGSLPFPLRGTGPNDWDDFEESVPELYATLDYPDLYVLGAFGKGRKQVQIFNVFDNVRFPGLNALIMKEPLKKRVASLGQGDFDLLFDYSHPRHFISRWALETILNLIESD